MITVSKIAAVYAEALYGLATDKSAAEEIEQELQGVVNSLVQDPLVWKFFEAPVLPTEDKMKVIEAVIKPHIGETVFNLLGVLARRKRMDYLKEISDAFTGIVDREMNRRRVDLQSSIPLSEGVRKELANAIGAYLKSEVILNVEENPELIGGLVIRSGDLLIDTSLRSSLNRIRTRLLEHKTIGEEYYEN